MKPFKSQRTQKSFFDAQVYDRLIPQNHFLVKLSQALDFAFVEDECRKYYSDLGRKGESPVVLFKMLFLAYLYNISERRIEEECNLNIAYKCFLGLEIDQKPPDHSTLSKFRDRIGLEGFSAIFNRIVKLARQKGLISDKLRIVDSTHLQANVDIFKSLKKRQGGDDQPGKGLPGSPDKDAKFGAKSKKKKFFGYKHHVGVDAENDLITGSVTSPGHMDDKDFLPDLAEDNPPDALTGDKNYDSTFSHEQLRRKGVKSLIIRKKTSPVPDDPEYESACKARKRIERVFAVQKRYHGGGRARYWGLLKTGAQNLMMSIVYDLKVMVDLLQPPGELCPET